MKPAQVRRRVQRIAGSGSRPAFDASIPHSGSYNSDVSIVLTSNGSRNSAMSRLVTPARSGLAAFPTVLRHLPCRSLRQRYRQCSSWARVLRVDASVRRGGRSGCDVRRQRVLATSTCHVCHTCARGSWEREEGPAQWLARPRQTRPAGRRTSCADFTAAWRVNHETGRTPVTRLRRSDPLTSEAPTKVADVLEVVNGWEIDAAAVGEVAPGTDLSSSDW